MSKLPHWQHAKTGSSALFPEPSFIPNLSCIPLSHRGSPSLSFTHSPHQGFFTEDLVYSGTRDTMMMSKAQSMVCVPVECPTRSWGARYSSCSPSNTWNEVAVMQAMNESFGEDRVTRHHSHG